MKNYLKFSSFLFALIFVAVSCSNDNNDSGGMGQETYNTTFKITDAPIDNANVDAVFVTISDVKVNGTSLEGFNKSTINLSALANGSTETLGSLDLGVGSYSDVVLELDFDTDADGNSPGCYVKMADGSKDKLEAAAGSISVNDDFDVFATSTNQIVLDFDLRKTIREEQGTLSSDFEFVSLAELSAGIRAVNEEFTGAITGTVNDSQNTSDKIVVYAYEKGSFNAETETQGSGDSNITFANAVTSASVEGISNSYSLNFLEEGEYELVFASYTEDGDEFAFNALLEAESTTGINLGSLSITGSLEISANVTITGTK